MKKYSSFVFYYLCLLSFLTLGIYLLFIQSDGGFSETENRLLQAFPSPTVQSIASGRFMDELEDYLSDSFPARDRLIAFSDSLMLIFGRKEESVRDALLAEVGGNEEELSISSLVAEEPSAALPDVPPSPGDIVSEGNTASMRPVDPNEVPKAGFYFLDSNSSRHVIDQYSGEQLAYIAQVLNLYKTYLPEDGRIAFLNMPISEYANPVTRDHKYTGWYYDIDDVMQPLVEEGIRIYDPSAILGPYKDDPDLFSTEDHHWHVKTAWYAFRDIASELGFAPTDFYEYSYHLRFSLPHGAYTPEQLQNMKLDSEDLMYQQINSPVNTWLITHLTQKLPSSVYNWKYHGYTVYIGGAKGPYRLFETGYHTGRNAMVIGDSFSFCLIPYLFPYYDFVLQTDYRTANYKTADVGASAAQYMKEYDVDDVFIITCNGSPLDSALFSWKLEKYLITDYSSEVS